MRGFMGCSSVFGHSINQRLAGLDNGKRITKKVTVFRVKELGIVMLVRLYTLDYLDFEIWRREWIC